MECRLCGNNVKQTQNRKNRTRCGSCNTKIRRLRFKIRAMALLGNSCLDCGIEGPPAIYDFHHRDPATKLFALGSVANKSWDSVVEELKKCELLCRNCHSIRHSSRYDKRWYDELATYGPSP